VRETYSSLLLATQNYCIDPETTSKTALSPSSTLLARLINDTVQYLYDEVSNYKSQPLPYTFSTAASETYYHIPPNLLRVESLTMTIGDVKYPLKPINSQAKWDQFQQLSITSSDVPQYYFMRQNDLGIYPTPADVKTCTLVGNFLPTRLSVADYVTGTVVVANDSAVVTGTTTVFTEEMIGRWFCKTDSSGLPVGSWYKVSSFSSTTVIGLESVFEETSLSGANYMIAQTPEIPEELHQYIPYRAAATYYATARTNPGHAQTLLNYFFTGDFLNPNRGGGIKSGVLGVINKYKNLGRSNSQITKLHKGDYDNSGWEWATTLTEAA